MFKLLFNLMLRQFANNRLYSIIKISCLSVGITVSLLIMLHVFDEFSYDNFYLHKDSVYQMVVTTSRSDNSSKSCVSTAGIGPSLLNTFPEITNMTRLSSPQSQYFVYNNKSIVVDDLVFADSSFFDLFSFKLKNGNPDFALAEPFTMVISDETARRFFGDENPIGKILKYQDNYNFKITGIIEKVPSNSHISYNALLSFASLYKMEGFYLGWDGGWNYYTYVRATKHIEQENFKTKLKPFLDEHINNKYRNYGVELSISFDKLARVYLHSQAPDTLPKSGNLQNLFVFVAIAFFILLIACINFINLSTAQVSQRTKETGIKKLLGATRKKLILQFLSETLLISLLALIASLLMAELLLPGFNNLFRTNVSLSGSSFYKVTATVILIGVFTGLLAGLYPAFFLSGFSPAKVLKGGSFTISKGSTFRNALVILQFFLAGGLIICTLIVYKQISFINNKNPGYDKANLMVINLTGEKSLSGYKLLKNKLKTLPQISAVGCTTAIPGSGLSSNGYIPEGHTESMMVHVMDVDADFLKMLGIQIILGNGFLDAAKPSGDILVNQAFAQQLGWNNPVGKKVARNGNHEIIAVVNDFHFAPLHHAIAPLIITNTPWEGNQKGFDYLVVRYTDKNTAAIISETEKIWKQMFPGEPFVFSFMDQMLESTYAGERNFSRVFTWASVLAIFIAGLGVFGLTTFITQQRRKEIGIRKTFGANPTKIIWLLGKQFITPVVAGNLLSWPVAWIIMQQWLENFAYTTSGTWWVYGGTLVLSTLFAFATVAWHSIQASLQNPIDALRYE